MIATSVQLGEHSVMGLQKGETGARKKRATFKKLFRNNSEKSSPVQNKAKTFLLHFGLYLIKCGGQWWYSKFRGIRQNPHKGPQEKM